jgi:hypothetical protein
MVVESFIKTSDDAEDVPYPPTNAANWNATIPTEVQSGLDQLAARMRIFETNNFSTNVAFLDFVTGNDTNGQLGNPAKPFKTGNVAATAVPSGGTIIVLNGVGTSVNVSAKIVNIVGFGIAATKLNNITCGSVATIYASNLELTSTNSIQGSGGSLIFLNNVKGVNVTSATGGSTYRFFNCEFTGDIVNTIECINSKVTGTVQLTGLVSIINNIFLNNVSIRDRVGGIISKNIFNTGANTPISWQTGFNTSQSGGKIDIYDNHFITTATTSIQEVAGPASAVMVGRIWNNYYESANLFNVTINNVTRNQFNNQLT